MYSLPALSPCVFIPRDHILIVLKSYFDGGGEADSTQYDHLTLAAMIGRPKHWRKFDQAWKRTLAKHHANYLHTTDAANLKGLYEDWDDESVDEFLNDCVTVIQGNTAPQKFGAGIRAITVTVVLKDLVRANRENPQIGTAEENCVIPCLNAALIFGQRSGCTKFECYFDQGEHFYGHVKDRMVNKRSKKHDSILADIVHLGESNMRLVPALQAADLFAWSVNDACHDHPLRTWQHRLLVDTFRGKEFLDYDMLTKDVNYEELLKIRSWNMPTRKRPR